MAGESFLDLVLDRVGIDPLSRGLQVLDAHDLPFPLLLHLPTVIAQVDTAASLLGVRDSLLTLLEPETPVTRLADLGGSDETVVVVPLGDLRPFLDRARRVKLEALTKWATDRGTP